MPRIILTLVAVAVLLPVTAQARPSRFKCTIGEHAYLQDNGGLKRISTSSFIGERFAIDRKSGVVAGGPFDTATNRLVPKVLEPGNADHSFKLLMTSPSDAEHSSVGYIEVRESQAEPRKPFIGTRGSEVVNGVCE